jgi:ParB-like chromosome segregation protein Spo0J
MSNLFSQGIMAQVDSIVTMLETLPLDDKVEMLNQIRTRLHEVSPFKNEPVDLVVWVDSDRVSKNDYNPNTVAPPEMRLLERSISEDGYTQPIVSYPREDRYEVVDGFHRHRVGKESKAVRTRVHGYLPVTQIRGNRTDIKHRMAATIRHNRARGVHGVVPMADMVAALLTQGWTDTDIAKELGMDADEVLRFKQNLGLPELFKDHEFSPSWE